MGVTIKEIAAYCKVSEGTVDRALNNRYGISEKTKSHILQVAKQLNYRANHAGRALATGSTMTIGVVCFDLYNNFFPQLIDTIEAQAKERGYFIDLILTHMDQKNERQGLEYLSARSVDGIILFPIGQGDEYIRYLKSLRIPIVTIYNHLSDDFSYIGIDNRKAFGDAVDFIIGHQYERIIFATPQMDIQESMNNNVYTLKMRLMGYCDGIRRAGIESLVVEGRKFAAETALRFAREGDAHTAVLCSNDSYALSIIEALLEENIRIPDELGIMGFDNINLYGIGQPKLTTVQYSLKEMGIRLFETLYSQMMGEGTPQRHIMPYSIVTGGTI